MNANEISSKANFRMNRLQKVSSVLRIFFFTTAIIAGLGGGLEILYGQVMPARSPAFAPTVTHLDFGPKMGLALNGVVNIAWAIGLWFAYKLFRFYDRGELFSPGVVSCLRRIGGMCILIGILVCVSSVIQVAHLDPRSSNFWSVTVPLFILHLFFRIIPGFAIICIAWIMDEGRKIQEEQELTI